MWKGDKAKELIDGYKFSYLGNNNMRNGVSIVVNKDLTFISVMNLNLGLLKLWELIISIMTLNLNLRNFLNYQLVTPRAELPSNPQKAP